MAESRSPVAPSRAMLISAFAAIYFIWGSTYLAIRLAIDSIPPFLMAGSRFLVAGGALYLWARLRGAERPTFVNWRAGAIAGALMLAGGNGSVVWSEQHTASGLAALIVAIIPLWMVVLEWLGPGGERPRQGVIVGVVLGLAGMALLVGRGSLSGGVPPLPAAVLMAGSFAFAVGSLYARRAPLPRSALLGAGIEMLGGGALLLLGGLLVGESASFHIAAISARSLWALLYLITFGSLIAFSAYAWLLGVSTPAKVATYAYVNPVVAVLLGWAALGEPISPRTMIAAAVIIAAVALITLTQGSGAARAVTLRASIPARTPPAGSFE